MTNNRAKDFLEIEGGNPLRGTVKISGAKNAISKMLVASLISDRTCFFENVPNIHEVTMTLSLCKIVGMEATWDQDACTLKVSTKNLISTAIPITFSGANRIPILMLGALLGRTKNPISIPSVGGCNIGKRPIDFHISALQTLGATIWSTQDQNHTIYYAQAKTPLIGAVITLPYPSVMATENAILAGCRAKGTTTIRCAAIEPEILDLILFLQKLGVIIHLESNRTIIIEESSTFYDVYHKVIPDRIETASFAMAALATKGRIFLEGAQQNDLITLLSALRKMNGGFAVHKNGIEFFYQGPLQGGIDIETNVHPGFLTDWQQCFVILLTQAYGTSTVHETVYEKRFGYIETLLEMGANIQLMTRCVGNNPCRFAHANHHHSVIVKGPTTFSGLNIQVPDLRGGFAYLMAALIAKGKSTITGLEYLDRGYDNFTEKLQQLGANIQRITDPTTYHTLIHS